MTSSDNLKIAISGPNASGKTSLAKALGDRLNLPVIKEEVSAIYQAKGLLNKMHKDEASRKEIIGAERQWINSFFEWAQDRERKYDENDRFVADRWEADLLDIWLVYFGREPNVDRSTAELLKILHQRAKMFDLVIIMPFSKPFTNTNNDENLVRQQSFTMRLLNNVTTRGIVATTPNLKILNIPNRPLSIDQRVDFVEKTIREIVL